MNLRIRKPLVWLQFGVFETPALCHRNSVQHPKRKWSGCQENCWGSVGVSVSLLFRNEQLSQKETKMKTLETKTPAGPRHLLQVQVSGGFTNVYTGELTTLRVSTRLDRKVTRTLHILDKKNIFIYFKYINMGGGGADL